VLAASRLPLATADEIAAFREANDWNARYAHFKAAALENWLPTSTRSAT
jgi:hypothetical protein